MKSTMQQAQKEAKRLLQSDDPITYSFMLDPDCNNIHSKSRYYEMAVHDLCLNTTPPEDKKIDRDEINQLKEINVSYIGVTYGPPSLRHPVRIHPVTMEDVKNDIKEINVRKREASRGIYQDIKSSMSPYERTSIKMALAYGAKHMKQHNLSGMAKALKSARKMLGFPSDK